MMTFSPVVTRKQMESLCEKYSQEELEQAIKFFLNEGRKDILIPLLEEKEIRKLLH